MQKFEPGCAETPDSYRTGSTNPPKSYRGVITVLLIMVILLISVVTVLSMMNIRLFRMLKMEQQTESSVQFSENGVAEASLLSDSAEGIYIPGLGLTGEEMESVYRQYNRWPQGLYITHVDADGPAAKADIRPGDILVAIDNAPIAGEEDFQVKIDALPPENPLHLTVFRQDREFAVSVTPIPPLN